MNHQKMLYHLCLFLALVCLSQQQNEVAGFVREVRQNYNEKLNSQLEQQILIFHNLELAYKAYAAYFDRADVDLPGFRMFFRKLENDSHANAISMTTYINSRGGRIRFPVVQLKDACNYIEILHDKQSGSMKVKPYICYFQSQVPDPYTAKKAKDKGGLSGYSWPGWFEKDKDVNWKLRSGLHGLEDALALEKSVNSDLINLAGLAKFHNDPHTKVTIEHLMEHQVDTIKELADLVTRLQQYLQDNDYPLGEYLLDRELDK